MSRTSRKRPNKLEITFSEDELAQVRAGAELERIPVATFARRAILADAIRFIKYGESSLRYYRPTEYKVHGTPASANPEA